MISRAKLSRMALIDRKTQPGSVVAPGVGGAGEAPNELTSARIGKQLELVTAVPTAAVALVCAIPVG